MPNCPVAGSVTSAEFTIRALRFSGLSEMRNAPPGSRTTPGTSGRASATVAGRLGISLASWPDTEVAGDDPCSTALPSPLTSTWVRSRAGTSVNSSVSESARREVEIALDRFEALLRNRKVVLRGRQSGESGTPAFIGVQDVERGSFAAFQLDTYRRYGQFALVDYRDFNLEAGLRRGAAHTLAPKPKEPRGKFPLGSHPL